MQPQATERPQRPRRPARTNHDRGEQNSPQSKTHKRGGLPGSPLFLYPDQLRKAQRDANLSARKGIRFPKVGRRHEGKREHTLPACSFRHPAGKIRRTAALGAATWKSPLPESRRLRPASGKDAGRGTLEASSPVFLCAYRHRANSPHGAPANPPYPRHAARGPAHSTHRVTSTPRAASHGKTTRPCLTPETSSSSSHSTPQSF